MNLVIPFLCALLFCAGLRAQAPAPGASNQTLAAQSPTPAQIAVPIAAEPHHRLVLQNNFVHVYNVAVQPLDATLLYRHDLPYLYVSLGPADIVNAVLGKPEAHVTLQDGETHYSPGGFALIARTDSGLLFRNITIELPKPQGTTRNICKEVIPGPLGECPKQAAAGGKNALATADDQVPYFETDELRVDLVKVGGGRDYVDEKPQFNSLLVALMDANLDANLGGQHITFLHGGDILWMAADTQRKVVDFLGTKSSFLLVSFKDSGNAAKP